MNKPLVTIAIPTYNRADSYLKETLESAINQTYDNLEILISDNCSTDHTEELVQSYDDPRLTYFRQKENLGALGNSNFLIQQARGDYFHMFHDDDQIENDFIETCMQYARGKTDIGIIMTGSRVIDEKGMVIRKNRNESAGKSLDDLILSWYLGEVNIFLCCTLFNTAVLREVGGFEEKYNYYDDVAANFKCTAKAGRLDIPDVKASFREHIGSKTSSLDIAIWSRQATRLLDLAVSLAREKQEEVEKIGFQRSARNVYQFASKTDSRVERLKIFWEIYKQFGFKELPPKKYCNELIPASGYVLYPYKTLSEIKKGVLKTDSQK